MTAAKPLLLFVVTEDWAFWSHRLPMAEAAMAAGFSVAVACRVAAHRARIEARGIRVLPLRHLRRESLNPFHEARAVAELVALYRRERPALVHHVALKPVLYGALAARLAGVPAAVNALAGMGFVFTATSLKARLLRPGIVTAFRLLLNRPGDRVLVQNPDDHALFVERGLVPAGRVVLIPGSGVDTDAFVPTPEQDGPPVALCVARLLWDKGIGELVAAARLLRDRGVPLRIQVAGDPDPANPRAIPAETLAEWSAEGVVEFLGRRDDIAALTARSHIAVLPSYREGMPKALLEGAAGGRPLVTTDVPGCRALVADGVNGLLVPVRDPAALADTLARLALDPTLRRRLGAEARRQAEEIYSSRAIGAAVAGLYRSLVPTSAPTAAPP
ncbi:glycosyltransferase family 4 protein [Novispirillum sp. DQ9]|uniref:glycosyltransferase family 4 protein n=1 Tax=Novispirillum sp. DQ9 TaxID=3398612 RepID=UPI003C7A3C41